MSGLAVRPRKSWGQNFMVSDRALETMVEALAPTLSDTVLEIGAGLGFLTERLAASAARVVALEKDRAFSAYLRGRFAGDPRVEILEGDCLEVPFFEHFKPRVLCIGNIPYQISSPLLERLGEFRSLWADILLTVQKEFADRLLALPGSRESGALSVWMHLEAETERVAEFSRGDFDPAPRVRSTLIRIRFRTTPLCPPPAQAAVRTLLRCAFQKRRKQILAALTHSSIGPDRKGWEKILQDAAIHPSARPETLTISQWIALGKATASFSTH